MRLQTHIMYDDLTNHCTGDLQKLDEVDRSEGTISIEFERSLQDHILVPDSFNVNEQLCRTSKAVLTIGKVHSAQAAYQQHLLQDFGSQYERSQHQETIQYHFRALPVLSSAWNVQSGYFRCLLLQRFAIVSIGEDFAQCTEQTWQLQELPT